MVQVLHLKSPGSRWKETKPLKLISFFFLCNVLSERMHPWAEFISAADLFSPWSCHWCRTQRVPAEPGGVCTPQRQSQPTPSHPIITGESASSAQASAEDSLFLHWHIKCVFLDSFTAGHITACSFVPQKNVHPALSLTLWSHGGPSPPTSRAEEGDWRTQEKEGRGEAGATLMNLRPPDHFCKVIGVVNCVKQSNFSGCAESCRTADAVGEWRGETPVGAEKERGEKAWKRSTDCFNFNGCALPQWNVTKY